MSYSNFLNKHKSKYRDTGVYCPICKSGTLFLHRSCLKTNFNCKQCNNVFSFDQLVHNVTNEEFCVLEEMIGDCLSDRL